MKFLQPGLLALLLICLVVAAPSFAQGQLNLQPEPSDGDGPAIEFEQKTIVLGDYAMGQTVSIDIPFKNVGSSDLEVEHVKPSCSCSALVWTESMVAPKQSGNIHAEIDTKDMGPGEHTKYFTVIYNSNPGVERIKVSFNLYEEFDAPSVDEAPKEKSSN